jgi:hypothetical protein
MADESEVWDLQLMKGLIDAVPLHPTFETVCASQCVSVETVSNWIRRGQQPNAPRVLERFAEAMCQAEAAHGAMLYCEYLRLLRSPMGANTARALFEMIKLRWKIGTGAELLSAAKQGPKRTDDLKAMLANPSPRLRAVLKETGWTRPDDWQAQARQLRAAPGDDVP